MLRHLDRLMLADRLASRPDFDCQRELRTMELLKLRFGEANLHNAEIMLGVSRGLTRCPFVARRLSELAASKRCSVSRDA